MVELINKYLSVKLPGFCFICLTAFFENASVLCQNDAPISALGQVYTALEVSADLTCIIEP